MTDLEMISIRFPREDLAISDRELDLDSLDVELLCGNGRD